VAIPAYAARRLQIRSSFCRCTRLPEVASINRRRIHQILVVRASELSFSSELPAESAYGEKKFRCLAILQFKISRLFYKEAKPLECANLLAFLGAQTEVRVTISTRGAHRILQG
jgi:hypothetical protein